MERNWLILGGEGVGPGGDGVGLGEGGSLIGDGGGGGGGERVVSVGL